MNKNSYDFDVVVVGGGHAGIESAHAAAKLGSKTLLITLDPNKIGLMPCNPAIGGVGKGHIVYEVSALGGLMPRLCTQTYLQARMLNTKKGSAVQGLRLQIDKFSYSLLSQQELKKIPNLTIHGGTAEDIILDENGSVCAVKTDTETFSTPTVILTTGTFLNGLCHIGQTNFSAGRRDEKAVTGLSQFLNKTGLKLGRLKTGTPPRLLKSSLDFSHMEYQEPDQLNYLFEFYPHTTNSTRACYITHTNENTHQVIKDNLHLSAMYSGNISGVGPRYCPSIEDKIHRFAEKKSHHVFVEPEGADSDEIYPNGISTSLPLDVQEQYIRTIAGFENAIITKAGYAVEYDFVYPNQLKTTLEVISTPGLFLAGQINGTTGYEEAAGQGIVAGINAHLKAAHKPPFILDRSESYIGVMIDDLIMRGVTEPYRMFTSRAEYRLLLRADNADQRLSPKAIALGCVGEKRKNLFENKLENLCRYKSELTSVDYSSKQIADAGFKARQDGSRRDGFAVLSQLDGCFDEVAKRLPNFPEIPPEYLVQLWRESLYANYTERQSNETAKLKRDEQTIIPANFDYDGLSGLSHELRVKLAGQRPTSIDQAGRIEGMTPSALILILSRIKSGSSQRQML